MGSNVFIIPRAPMSEDAVIIEKEGKMVWIRGGCGLAEPIDNSMIDLKINLPPAERGPGCFGEAGITIAQYIELENIENGYLIKHTIYQALGPLIIAYYKEWKWRVEA